MEMVLLRNFQINFKQLFRNNRGTKARSRLCGGLERWSRFMERPLERLRRQWRGFEGWSRFMERLLERLRRQWRGFERRSRLCGGLERWSSYVGTEGAGA